MRETCVASRTNKGDLVVKDGQHVIFLWGNCETNSSIILLNKHAKSVGYSYFQEVEHSLPRQEDLMHYLITNYLDKAFDIRDILTYKGYIRLLFPNKEVVISEVEGVVQEVTGKVVSEYWISMERSVLKSLRTQAVRAGKVNGTINTVKGVKCIQLSNGRVFEIY